MPLDKINPGHDILFHYRRFNALMEALIDGNFPIYYDYEAFNNYGYGARWFYPDLILIPFAWIANYTGFVFSYKLMWFVMTFLCGLFTYKAVSTICKNNNVAFIVGLLYTFSTYRLQDIYERGAVGEALSFTFLPIIALGLYQIIKGDYKKWYIISIGFTLLIYSHLLSSVISFITVIIFILIYYKAFFKEPKRLWYLVVAGIVSLFLSSYFILPFIEQIINCNYQVSDSSFKNDAGLSFGTFFKSILYPHTIFAKKEFEPYIGILLILCISLRLFIRDKSKTLRKIDLLTLLGLIYLFLSLNIIPWDRYPLKLINFIQFPWRLFEFSTLFFSISGGSYLCVLINKHARLKFLYPLLIILIGCLIITTSARYKVVRYYYTAMTSNPIMTLDNYFWFFVSLEYFPAKLNSVDIIKEKGDKIDYKNSSTSISDIEKGNGYINFNIKTLQKEEIELPLIYYKGYSAQLYNERMKMPINLKVRQSDRGLVEIELPSNPRLGNVTVKFSGTFIQKYSIYFTLISFIILIIYIYTYNRKQKKRINA